MATLVVHTGGIGDFLLALPSIRGLAQQGPVELLGIKERLEPAVIAGIARAAHALDAVDFYSLFAQPSERLINFLGGFDRAVAWMRDDDRAIAQALKRCGIEDVRTLPGLPPKGWDRHASEYYLERLGLEGGLRVQLELPTATAGGPAPDVIIHPGSGSPKKNWPLERFQELARYCEAKGHSVSWCLGPAEHEGGLAGAIDPSQCLAAASLAEVAVALRRCNLYIGNDSGISHLAGATGCRTLVVFGPTDPRIWRPLGDRVTVVAQGAWPPATALFDTLAALLEQSEGRWSTCDSHA